LGKYYQQTITRTIVFGIALIIIIASVLIWIIYGSQAAFTGVSCMLAGLLPLIFIYLVFVFMDYVINKYRTAEENQDKLPPLSDGEQSNEDTNGGQG